MILTRTLIVLALGLALAIPAYAQLIEVSKFTLESTEEGHVVNADFDFELTPRLEEALNGGVPLIFAIEFELTRARWYWFDEKTATARINVRLSYNPLLRQYRVSTGPLQRNFSAFADTMRTLSRVRSWLVLDKDKLQPETQYVAAVRMRLDTTQLPRPFQFSALTDRELSLASPWKRLPLVLETERAPR